MIVQYDDLPPWIKTLKRIGDYPPVIERPKKLMDTIFTWSLDGHQQYLKPYTTEETPISGKILKCRVLGEGDVSAREETVAISTVLDDIDSGFLQELRDESVLAKLALLDF